MTQLCAENGTSADDGVIVAPSDFQHFLNLLHDFENQDQNFLQESKSKEESSWEITSTGSTYEENIIKETTALDMLKSLLITSSAADLSVLKSLIQSLNNRDPIPPVVSVDEWKQDRTSDAMIFYPDGSLNLDLFRVHLCKNESSVHDRKNCSFHHTHRDRRRSPATYKAEQCDDSFDVEEDSQCRCPQGDRCDKCHNRHELLYHPDIYKQRFCSSYSKGSQNLVQCHRGRFCAFAHSRKEIRCQLFPEEAENAPDYKFFMMDFKNLWCPYGTQHDWHGCLYAHTYQDCRRSPLIGYGSEPCPYWQKDLHSADYQRRCPYGTQCPYSHGSKEQLYHPAYYKTMPCTDYKANRICPRGDLCAFYHELEEKRSCNPVEDGNNITSTGDSENENSCPLVYEYSKPLPAVRMAFLQLNFMNPPLFNLDDFEAFGHGTRTDNHKRNDNKSMWYGNGPESPVKSKIRNRNYMPFRASSFTDYCHKQDMWSPIRHGNYSERNLRMGNSLDFGSDLVSTAPYYPLSPGSQKMGQQTLAQDLQF